MKKALFILMAIMTLNGTAFAHCGKCGVGEAKDDKMATLKQAADELESSNPELAGKLRDLAGQCEHKH